MANNKSTKSRTSKNRLSKKNSAPHWVIGIVLAIVVATGAFLVYQSFASSSGSETTPIGTSTLYCNSRDCYMTPGPGRTASTRYVATGSCHFNLVWASNSKSGSRVWRCVLP